MRDGGRKNVYMEGDGGRMTGWMMKVELVILPVTKTIMPDIHCTRIEEKGGVRSPLSPHTLLVTYSRCPTTPSTHFKKDVSSCFPMSPSSL